MILDFSTQDLVVANGFEIMDLDSGQPLPMVPPYDDLWYADDEQGVIRYYIRSYDGKLMIAREESPDVPLMDQDQIAKYDLEGNPIESACVAWKEEKRRIKIVPKSELAPCLT